MSVVWKFFSNNGEAGTECDLCDKQYPKLSGSSLGSTSVMLRHLRIEHPYELSQELEKRHSEENAPENQRLVNQERFNTKFYDWLQSAGLSFDDVVENAKFRAMIESLSDEIVLEPKW